MFFFPAPTDFGYRSLKMLSNLSRDQREKGPNDLTFIFSIVSEEYINDVSKCTYLHREKCPNRFSRASEEISTLSQNALRFVKRLKKKGPNNLTIVSSRAPEEISRMSQNVLRFAKKPKISQ